MYKDMYVVRKENLEFLRDVKNEAYSRILGMTTTNISNIFNGRSTKLSTAQSIIGVRYNIANTDDRMKELIEKHFRKIN